MRRLLAHSELTYPEFSLSCPAGQYADWSAQWSDRVSYRECSHNDQAFDYNYDKTPYDFFEEVHRWCENAIDCYGLACEYHFARDWPDNYDPMLIDRCYPCVLTGNEISEVLTDKYFGPGGTHSYQGWILNRDSTQCVECPAQSSSPAGSNRLEDCTCNIGYEGPDGGPCPAPPPLSCDADQHKVETTENVYGSTLINRVCQTRDDDHKYWGQGYDDDGYTSQPGLTHDFCRTKCIEWTDCTAVAFTTTAEGVLYSCYLCPPASEPARASAAAPAPPADPAAPAAAAPAAAATAA